MEAGTTIKTFHDYLKIVRRRKKSILLPILIVFSLAVIVSVAIPRVYKSSSTILIEAQEIPPEYVTSTLNNFAEQRLLSINQRVMSATKLLEIINKYNLYSDLRKKLTSEEVIEKMRKDIKFDTVSAEVDNQRAARSAKVTIAFTISYYGRNPGVTQQIANVLASLYLDENLKVREQQSAGAAKFFDDELKGVKARMAELDAQLAVYKEKHVDALPELNQLNYQELARLGQNVDQLYDQLRGLKEKESNLRTQLAGIPSDAEMQKKTHLNELKVQLVNLKTRFSDEYPDVIKIRQEIADLEKARKDKEEDATPGKNDNMTQALVASQLAGAQAEMESVKRQIAILTEKRNDMRRRVNASPRVEEGYKALFTERTDVQAKYDDLMKKYMEANVARSLEKEQMGERFTLLDAARLPEAPVIPNVPVILLVGLVLGTTGGAGIAAYNEISDTAVYSADALARIMPFPIVAGLPEIVTEEDRARRRSRRRLAVIGTVILAIVALAAIHFLIMDLDVFWARLMRKLAI
jgi:polysaccharide chain length determinant protein (PEP-CTERM system associated)